MTKIDSLLSGLRNNGYAYAAELIEALQTENVRCREAKKNLIAEYQELLGQQAELQKKVIILERQNAEARAAVSALISAEPYEPMNARHVLEDPEAVLYKLKKLIADENYAASFEDIALYREALLQVIPDPE